MAVIQKLKFGAKDMLGTYDKVFQPIFGPTDLQVMRRQPFGTEGELELLGKTGGQSIIIPIRLFRDTYEEVRKAIDDYTELRVAHRDKLSVQFTSLRPAYVVGIVTFDSVQEVSPARPIVLSTDDDALAWQVDLMLTFRKLWRGD